jgi:CRP-like cAMP-binding protein
MLYRDADQQDQEILRSQPLFRGLDEEARQVLLSDARVQRVPRNTVLFLQGEPAARFYVIFDGWVKLFRESEDGDESVIAVFTRGDSFAEAAIFDQKVYPVSAAAVEESRILMVPAGSFIGHLKENSSYALNMMGAMSRHLRLLVQQVELLSVRSSTERVAEFIGRLCPPEATSATIKLPLDKALIAGRLGMQPETLSRALAKLREQGIETNRGEVEVPDVAALRRLGHLDEEGSNA